MLRDGPSVHSQSPALFSFLTLMLLVANLTKTKRCKNLTKNTEILAHGYSSESSQRELSNEYQLDRVSMFFKDLYVLVLWTKVVSALEGLITYLNVSEKITLPIVCWKQEG